jgi:two-component system chemotaxis response regulator CheB
MPAAIVVLLHMPLGSSQSLKWSLERFSRLPIIEVENQERLQQGFIFVPAAGGSATCSHTMIMVEHNVSDRPMNSINHLLTSVAPIYSKRVIGVILSGLSRDGADGLRAVHKAGGLTVVQDPSEAEYRDMPTNAMQGSEVTFCLKLADIGPALELLVRRTTLEKPLSSGLVTEPAMPNARFETGLEVAARTLRDRAALLARLDEQSSRNPGTQEFLRNELASLRRDVQAIDDLLKTATHGEKC